MVRWLLVAMFVAVSAPVPAHDVGVTSVRLLELSGGGFALEAQVQPDDVTALRPPVVPGRFTDVKPPVYRHVGAGLSVTYEFGGSDAPLEARDTLLLPWQRSGVLVSAHWRDGGVHRGLFPRTHPGIRIPVDTVKPARRSPVGAVQSRLRAAIDHLIASPMHLVLILGLAYSGSVGRAARLALAFAGGHGLAMVAVEVGVPSVQPLLAEIGVGVGAVLVARTALRDVRIRLWPLVAVLGLFDGIGVAGALESSGLGPGEPAPAHFGVAAVVGGVQLIAASVLADLWKILSRTAIPRIVTMGAGCAAVALVLVAAVSGSDPAGNHAADPADAMAAARFQPGTAPVPWRIEDPVRLFLTVGQREVRVEILARLRDILESLHIDSEPGALSRIELQDRIAQRALPPMAASAVMEIDGRPVTPDSQRVDFVKVGGLGSETRIGAGRESPESPELGVTLVYWLDLPPSEIDLTWALFPPPTGRVAAVWGDPTGSQRVVLTRQRPILHWSNDLSRIAQAPVRAVVVAPPSWPLLSIGLAVLAGVVAVTVGGRRRGVGALVCVCLASAIVAYPFYRSPLPFGVGTKPSREEAARVVDELVTNVYGAFDLGVDEAACNLLEMRRTPERPAGVCRTQLQVLDLEDRGGSRVMVDDVDVERVAWVRRDGAGGYAVRATWAVWGSTSHFGHDHDRRHRFDGVVRVVPVDGVWRIRGIEVEDVRRSL